MINWSASLYTPALRGSTPLWAITDRIQATWRRTTRAVGGYWLGTCQYNGTREQLLEMYLEGLGRQVIEESGGLTTWRGQITELELTLDGVTWTRSLLECANAVKCLYTRLYDNLLTNGGAESGAWAAVNGATVTQTSEWTNAGLYSCKIVVADTTERGGRIGTVAVTAGLEYKLTGVLRILSGKWKVYLKRADTGATLDAGTTHDEAGDVSIDITLDAANTYSGDAYVDVLSVSAAGTVYGDSFNFSRAPVPDTQTGWYTDTASIAEYGRIELAEALVGMTDDAANSKAQTLLRERAWPNPQRPSDLTTLDLERLNQNDKLALTVSGFAHTLANRHCLTPGVTAISSDQVVTLINESEFVECGSITANSNPYMIDARAPITHWQALKDIIEAGDGTDTGARWIGGVYNDFMFDYGPAPYAVAYQYQHGSYHTLGGDELEPWFALPGSLLYLEDVPAWPGAISATVENDPHLEFVEEVEMSPATPRHPQGTLTMRNKAL